MTDRFDPSKDVDLHPSEWKVDNKPYCYQRTFGYQITVLIFAYPVWWLVHTFIEPPVRQLVRFLLG